MTVAQYTDFFSLIIFGVLLIPAVILGVCGKKIKYYGMFVSIPALCMIFGMKSFQMIQFLIFIACEFILIIGYYYLRKKTKSKVIYFTIFVLSMVPIFMIKLCVYSERYKILGFIGISYISFRIWQLIIEIHDDKLKEFSIPEILYFLTFFPTISSGPIDRYNRFKKDINTKLESNTYINDYLFVGLKKTFLAITYKFAIAALINCYVLEKIPPAEGKTLTSTIIYMYAYTFYLFFDFAGYSNFAIGTGYILGIKVPENFNKPFLSHNMKEFWDRWHISLSKWFGDYLFSRFVLNTLRNKTFKSKKVAVRCGYMLTMTTMGIWHGFYLYYIAYGVYQGLMLLLTDVYTKSKTYRKFKKSRYYDIVSRIICFQVIAFGMLIFSGYLFKF